MERGNGSGFTTIDEFTTMATHALSGMCMTEMQGMLSWISETYPQAFQLALNAIGDTVFERHEHEGEYLDVPDPGITLD